MSRNKKRHDNDVIDFANDVINNIDKDQLEKCFLMKSEYEDENATQIKKKMETLDDQLANCFYRKGLTLAKLDLSLNKLNTLPNNVADLMTLKYLKVARNKLVNFPLWLSSLSNLHTIDVSNNRLISFKSLNLFSIMTLMELNAKHNETHGILKIHVWIAEI